MLFGARIVHHFEVSIANIVLLVLAGCWARDNSTRAATGLAPSLSTIGEFFYASGDHNLDQSQNRPPAFQNQFLFGRQQERLPELGLLERPDPIQSFYSLDGLELASGLHRAPLLQAAHDPRLAHRPIIKSSLLAGPQLVAGPLGGQLKRPTQAQAAQKQQPNSAAGDNRPSTGGQQPSAISLESPAEVGQSSLGPASSQFVGRDVANWAGRPTNSLGSGVGGSSSSSSDGQPRQSLANLTSLIKPGQVLQRGPDGSESSERARGAANEAKVDRIESLLEKLRPLSITGNERAVASSDRPPNSTQIINSEPDSATDERYEGGSGDSDGGGDDADRDKSAQRGPDEVAADSDSRQSKDKDDLAFLSSLAALGTGGEETDRRRLDWLGSLFYNTGSGDEHLASPTTDEQSSPPIEWIVDQLLAKHDREELDERRQAGPSDRGGVAPRRVDFGRELQANSDPIAEQATIMSSDDDDDDDEDDDEEEDEEQASSSNVSPVKAAPGERPKPKLKAPSSQLDGNASNWVPLTPYSLAAATKVSASAKTAAPKTRPKERSLSISKKPKTRTAATKGDEAERKRKLELRRRRLNQDGGLAVGRHRLTRAELLRLIRALNKMASKREPSREREASRRVMRSLVRMALANYRRDLQARAESAPGAKKPKKLAKAATDDDEDSKSSGELAERGREESATNGTRPASEADNDVDDDPIKHSLRSLLVGPEVLETSQFKNSSRISIKVQPWRDHSSAADAADTGGDTDESNASNGDESDEDNSDRVEPKLDEGAKSRQPAIKRPHQQRVALPPKPAKGDSDKYLGDQDDRERNRKTTVPGDAFADNREPRRRRVKLEAPVQDPRPAEQEEKVPRQSRKLNQRQLLELADERDVDLVANHRKPRARPRRNRRRRRPNLAAASSQRSTGSGDDEEDDDDEDAEPDDRDRAGSHGGDHANEPDEATRDGESRRVRRKEYKKQKKRAKVGESRRPAQQPGAPDEGPDSKASGANLRRPQAEREETKKRKQRGRRRPRRRRRRRGGRKPSGRQGSKAVSRRHRNRAKNLQRYEIPAPIVVGVVPRPTSRVGKPEVGLVEPVLSIGKHPQNWPREGPEGQQSGSSAARPPADMEQRKSAPIGAGDQDADYYVEGTSYSGHCADDGKCNVQLETSSPELGEAIKASDGQSTMVRHLDSWVRDEPDR